jgi:hypothetical protein
MAQVVPSTLIPAIATDNDAAIADYRNRTPVIITPVMLADGNSRQALFEGIVTFRRTDKDGRVLSTYTAHCRLSPIFNPQGSRLIGYQVEEGGNEFNRSLVLPEDVRPLPAPSKKQ